ncbi:MAG: hypothetical protein K2J39_08950 [Ruminococcus sp.]|nr:hypothetical protein [Ruminococcus sp.]
MKKILIIMLAMFTLVSCAKNETSTDENDFSGIQQETVQPDPLSDSTTITTTKPTTTISQIKSETTINTTEEIATQNTTNAETKEVISAISQENQETTTETTSTDSATATTTTTETVPADAQPDPLGAGAFSYNEDGAVQFVENPESNDEQTLISAGQALFESACQTEWNFTVGCPYELDMGNVIRNGGYEWIYYKITDENIHSFADIERDYYNVFSERYPHEDLKMLYVERQGSVYAMNGQRDMNAYYSMSRITGIESRTDDEIIFTVEHQFEGTDQNPDSPYTENDKFSVVISPDGKWKAGQFRLPY